MIEINGLYKSFGKNDVLKDIDLDFSKPGIVAILGPNGSGKTTLLKCFLGLTRFDEGEIKYRGKSVLNQYDYRRQLSHLPQIACFPENLTGQDLILMIKDLRGGRTNESYFIDLFDLKGEIHKKMGTSQEGTNKKLICYCHSCLIIHC